ncbi:MAG: SRPBCC domain-containing protein [Longimicrobiales bacterium]|nr:SRPBCC domain-containing protein [Longimicrobiales bacterium]
MSVNTAGAVRLQRTIAADRKRVWDAWTQPEQMRRWSCPAPGGCKEVVSDFRVGGSFTIRMEVDGKAHTAFGTYREIEAPRRLVYTWDWEEEDNAMGETLVTVEFQEVDGGTRVSLVHEGFPAEEARAGHEEGWTACLEHFTALVD